MKLTIANILYSRFREGIHPTGMADVPRSQALTLTLGVWYGGSLTLGLAPKNQRLYTSQANRRPLHHRQ